MKLISIERKVDPLGRVTLPAGVRRLLELEHGSELEVYVDEGKIVFVKKGINPLHRMEI